MTMTPKERLLAALRGEEPDRLPVTTHHLQAYWRNRYMNDMRNLEIFERFVDRIQAREGVRLFVCGIQPPMARALQRSGLADRLGDEAGPIEHSRVCLYGNSASGHFVLDALPDDPSIVVAAGFSGHGFKFAPVIGELAADLVAGQPQAVEAFRMASHLY